MARKLRIEYPGAIYHVMNRGDRREAIFHDEEPGAVPRHAGGGTTLRSISNRGLQIADFFQGTCTARFNQRQLGGANDEFRVPKKSGAARLADQD